MSASRGTLSPASVPVTRVVAALISNRAQPASYLVQQRLPAGQRGLLWEFPGGKVEAAESDEQALVRECREELGIELAVGKRLWGCLHQYADLTVDLVVYEGRIERGSPKPLRAKEIRYLSPDEMKVLPFCQADWPLLEALATGHVGC